MERSHHPNVIRTWAVGRIRQGHPPVLPVPAPAGPRRPPKPAVKPKPKPGAV